MFHRVLLRAASMALGAGAKCTSVALGRPRTKPVPINPEATIYRDANSSGLAVAIQAEEPNLGLNWRVSSIRVPSGA